MAPQRTPSSRSVSPKIQKWTPTHYSKQYGISAAVASRNDHTSSWTQPQQADMALSRHGQQPQHDSVFPDRRHGFEPALATYELHHPGDGGPARWHAAYSQNALSNSIRGGRHEFNMRNPELHAQLDVMADGVDRVHEQAQVLRKAIGSEPMTDMKVRSALESEILALTHQNEGLSLTVAALVQSLVGLGASAFNWSEGLGTPRRKGLAELVHAYVHPCSHIDHGLQDLCADLKVELARERLDDIPSMPWAMFDTKMPWAAGEAQSKQRDVSPFRDGRSPPPTGVATPTSPQKSKFQVRSAVQGSLQAWKEPDAYGNVTTPARSEKMQTSIVTTPALHSVIVPLSRLKITIIHAQGLRNADATTTVALSAENSDPYCICEVPGKKGTTVQTPVVNNCPTPTWNHAFVCDYAAGDSLKFSIWDSDKKLDDHLGTAILEQDRFFPSGFHGMVVLTKGGKGARDPKLKVKIEVLEAADLGEPQPEASPAKKVSGRSFV